MVIKTKRLNIYPASNDEMESLISKETVRELKKAYQEMLSGCLEHPDKREWYAIWMIELSNGTKVGKLCFKGIDEYGLTEIGYGILDDYQGLGYATEAITAVSTWALGQDRVKGVIAEVNKENVASIRVLLKSGFIANGKMGEEGPIYCKTK